MRMGASATDFSGIVCIYCDFSGVAFAKGTDFFNTLLVAPRFAHASLRSAIFDSAWLVEANFFDADLREASFTETMVPDVAVHQDTASPIPVFECADLRGARLDGVPLVAYLRQLPDSKYGFEFELIAWVPLMTRTKMDSSTQIPSLVVSVMTIGSDEYYRTTRAMKDLELSQVWPFARHPFVFDPVRARGQPASYVREPLGEIRFSYITAIDTRNEATSSEAVNLVPVLSQGSWLTVPDIADTVKYLEQLAATQAGAEFERELAARTKATWDGITAPDCSSNPDPRQLIIRLPVPASANPIEHMPARPPSPPNGGGA